MSTLNHLLAACMQDAADRAMLEATVLHHTTLEGDFVLVQDSSGAALALATSTDVQRRPFETALRDRARAAAARAQAPLLIICSWRTIVAFSVDALTKRKPLCDCVVGIWEGARVSDEHQLEAAAHRVSITECLRLALTQSTENAIPWLTSVLNELRVLFPTAEAHKLADVLQLADLPVVLPPIPVSYPLLIDLLNAYAAEQQRRGGGGLPAVPDLHVDVAFTELASNLLYEITTVDGLGGDVNERREYLQLWLALETGMPVPTYNAIDLALISSGLDLSPRMAGQHQPITVVESGSSLGRLAQRLSALVPGAVVEIQAGLQSDPHTCLQTLERLSIPATGVLLWFAPLAVLREKSYGQVRRTLIERFHLRWVILDDAESLTTPDKSVCCLVATSVDGIPHASATSFVNIRLPMSEVIPSLGNPDVFDEDRIDSLRTYVKYLAIGKRSRVNQQVSVRHIERSVLLSMVLDPESSWDYLLVPPDVIASIVSKVAPTLRSLRSIAEVTNGLRTGANDVLAPTIAEIDAEQLEAESWQRKDADGVITDNVLITTADEVESIAGIVTTEKRLLMLPDDRSVIGTHVQARLARAEQGGVSNRPSLRNRDPWWRIPEFVVPDLLFFKNQGDRWLIAINSTQAIITDAAVGAVLHNPEHAESVALWLNSSLGMFWYLLLRQHEYVADVTVRDMRELQVPTDDVLLRLSGKKHRDMLYRPITSVADEFGTSNADDIHAEKIKRDRRRLDTVIMHDIYQLTTEEQRWVYRLVLTWRSTTTNLRYLGTALAAQLTATHRVVPLIDWYDVRIAQLPIGTSRTIVLPPEITSVSFEHGMFSWHISLWSGQRVVNAIDCSSEAEAELLSTLASFGKRTLEVPTDAPLIEEMLTLAREFSHRLTTALDEITSTLPADIKADVIMHVKQALI